MSIYYFRREITIRHLCIAIYRCCLELYDLNRYTRKAGMNNCPWPLCLFWWQVVSIPPQPLLGRSYQGIDSRTTTAMRTRQPRHPYSSQRHSLSHNVHFRFYPFLVPTLFLSDAGRCTCAVIFRSGGSWQGKLA